MSHQAGLLTTLHNSYPASTYVFLSKEAIWRPPCVEGSQILGAYSVLPYKACMYHSHIPLLHISSSGTNECWVFFPLNMLVMIYTHYIHVYQIPGHVYLFQHLLNTLIIITKYILSGNNFIGQPFNFRACVDARKLHILTHGMTNSLFYHNMQSCWPTKFSIQ